MAAAVALEECDILYSEAGGKLVIKGHGYCEKTRNLGTRGFSLQAPAFSVMRYLVIVRFAFTPAENIRSEAERRKT